MQGFNCHFQQDLTTLIFIVFKKASCKTGDLTFKKENREREFSLLIKMTLIVIL